jgi:hypothetical protein
VEACSTKVLGTVLHTVGGRICMHRGREKTAPEVNTAGRLTTPFFDAIFGDHTCPRQTWVRSGDGWG